MCIYSNNTAMKKLIGIFLPTEFQVVFQSSSDVVLQSLKRAVPLCCLSSHHSESTYTWKCLEQPSTQYPSSPILHVKKAGTYKCTVYWGDQQTASHLFVVKCIPGIYIRVTQTLLLVHIIHSLHNIYQVRVTKDPSRYSKPAQHMIQVRFTP